MTATTGSKAEFHLQSAEVLEHMHFQKQNATDTCAFIQVEAYSVSVNAAPPAANKKSIFSRFASYPVLPANLLRRAP